MEKEQTKFSHNFKRTAPSGVNARALRAHRRSVEWKQMREETVARRRNCGTVSPVQEKHDDFDGKQTRATLARADGKANIGRKEQLMKWKEEKEFKRTIEVLEKAKKKPFRVVHIDQEVVAFKKSLLPLPKVASTLGTTSVGSRQTGSQATCSKPAKNKFLMTAPHTGSTSGASIYATRSRSTATDPQGTLDGKLPAVKKTVLDKQKGKIQTKITTAKLDQKRLKKGPRPEAVSQRVTRSSRQAVVSSAEPVHATDCRLLSSKDSSSKLSSEVFQLTQSKLKKVNMHRGSESFAPADFQFTAPENLKSFSFNRLDTSTVTTQSDNRKAESSSYRSSSFRSPSASRRESRDRLSKSISASELSSMPPVSLEHQTAMETVECFVVVERLPEHVLEQINVTSRDENHSTPNFSLMGIKEKSRKKSKSHVIVDKIDNEQTEFPDKRKSGFGVKRQKSTVQEDNEVDEDQKQYLDKVKSPFVGKGRKSTVEVEAENDQKKSHQKARGRRSILKKEKDNDIRSTEGGGINMLPLENNKNNYGTSKESAEFVGDIGMRRHSVLNKAFDVIEGVQRKSVLNLEPDKNASEYDNELINDGHQLETQNVQDVDSMKCEQQKNGNILQANRKRSVRKSVSGDKIQGDTGVSFVEEILKEDIETISTNQESNTTVKKNKRKSIKRPLTVRGTSEDNDVGTEQVIKMTDPEEQVELIAKWGTEDNDDKTKEIVMHTVEPVVFQTPCQAVRSLRARSIVFGLDYSRRKTPRNNRSSLILRTLSPEEGIEVLRCSPMIELNRRKLKTPPGGNSKIQVAPMPSFNEVDDNICATSIEPDDLPDVVIPSALPFEFTVPFESTVANNSLEFAIADNSHANTKSQTNSLSRDKSLPEEEKIMGGVTRFRNLLSFETNRLSSLCSSWRQTLGTDADQLNDEVSGEIHTTIGQAQLLMSQRFKQFSGLVDNCEFKTSEKEVTCTDLQGFWDMIYFQVEDVNEKFAKLDRLKASQWTVEKPISPMKPKQVKKKVGAVKKAVTSKTTTARPNFAAFRQKLQQHREQENGERIESVPNVSPNEVKTFDCGFFKIESPIQKTKLMANAEKCLSIQETENTPKATSVARTVLKKMARKSLLESIKDCDQNSVTPLGESVEKSGTSQTLMDSNFKSTVDAKNKTRKSTRKSVCLVDKVVHIDTTPSDFSKYLLQSSITDVSPSELVHQPIAQSGTDLGIPLASADDDDEVPIVCFKNLKLGYTPGVNGKSRRISSFTPLQNVGKVAVFGGIDKNEGTYDDLMTFSPLTSSSASNKTPYGEGTRNGKSNRRRSERISVNTKSALNQLK